jgi:hypothetical protein
MKLKFLCFGNTPKHIIIFSRSQNTLVSSMYIMQLSNNLQRKKLYNFTPAEKQNIHRFPAFSSGTSQIRRLERSPNIPSILRLLNLTYDCQLFFPILWTYIWFSPHFVELLPVISGQNAKFYRQNPSHLVICSYLNLMFTVRKSSFSAIFRIPRSSRLLLLKKQSGPIPNQSV